MCRNIRQLYNFEPPATDDEIKAASLQFVRKVSGFAKPSLANEKAFNAAIDDVAKATKKLVYSLVTNAEPKNREVERKLAVERAKKRYGNY